MLPLPLKTTKKGGSRKRQQTGFPGEVLLVGVEGKIKSEQFEGANRGGG